MESNYNITPKAAIVDSNEEALRNLYVAVMLTTAVLKSQTAALGMVDQDIADVFNILDGTLESVNMYLQRVNVWNLND
ncbi:putative holin [Streptomyces phage Coruscant]|uniref:Putative holin n=1 Tax=Streptomyces phage Coruscant TaxID=2739834 RepID=A0A7G4AWF4_9CAUD|nr:putative holin [Streptomyces phage Coruscant]QMP84344.1 putative holin [Streptomyces phage Coruscant]